MHLNFQAECAWLIELLVAHNASPGSKINDGVAEGVEPMSSTGAVSSPRIESYPAWSWWPELSHFHRANFIRLAIADLEELNVFKIFGFTDISFFKHSIWFQLNLLVSSMSKTTRQESIFRGWLCRRAPQCISFGRGLPAFITLFISGTAFHYDCGPTSCLSLVSSMFPYAS